MRKVFEMEDLDCAIAAARKYGYKFRIVTLDGQVLNPGGSMTGGSASRSAGILSRANELERLNSQSSQLRQQLVQAEQDSQKAQREAAAAAPLLWRAALGGAAAEPRKRENLTNLYLFFEILQVH